MNKPGPPPAPAVPRLPPLPGGAPPRPPPLPPRARPLPARSVVPTPQPSDDAVMSTRAKLSLADIALQLRDEQLQARIVHYKAELETSPELDAVTAGVVAELQAMQKAHAPKVPSARPPAADKAQIEIELIGNLKQLLAKLFRPGELSSTVDRKIGEAGKRFARLFFESELCERIQGTAGEPKTMRYGAQALYLVLARNREFLGRQLDAFTYETPEEQADAKVRLEDFIKEERNAFLGATMPELNALLKRLTDLLKTFFTVDMPPVVGELAWEVVKEARLADSAAHAGYKIGADAFPRFRTAFERKLLQRLVTVVEDGMLAHIRSKGTEFRAETLRFVADPQIFTDVCELVCDSVYDYLYSDGFLDLPADWRARLGSANT